MSVRGERVQGWGVVGNQGASRKARGPMLILASFSQARSDFKVGWVSWGLPTIQR